jgi:hypothetical protein
MSESGNIISLDNMKHGAVQTICVITYIMSTSIESRCRTVIFTCR